MPRHTLGEFEKAILLALITLQNDAYGVSIQKILSASLDRDVAIGAVYTSLQRLEDKGFVASTVGDPTPVRGGRAKRFFRIEAPGVLALEQSEARAHRLRRLQPAFGVGRG